jgi:hypothetical protein
MRGAAEPAACRDSRHDHHRFESHLHRSRVVLPDTTEVTPVSFVHSLLVAPLVTFLPGATLAVGTMELAARQMVSGARPLLWTRITCLRQYTASAYGQKGSP